MKISPISLLFTFVVFAAGFITAILVGEASLTSPVKSAAEARLADLKPQIQDAIRRWSIKAQQSEISARENYEPRSMFIPIQNQGQGMVCIELALKPGNFGGSPVYCYQDEFFNSQETIKLVAEYSDVE